MYALIDGFFFSEITIIEFDISKTECFEVRLQPLLEPNSKHDWFLLSVLPFLNLFVRICYVLLIIQPIS
jgi:hypothetical protein